VFGEKWAAMADFVRLLALAMPFLTLQVMFPPMCNAMGRPGLGARIALIGAVIMPLAFLVGIQFGALGLAWAWLTGYPLFALLTARIAGRVIGLELRRLLRAVAPGFIAAVVMAIIVMLADGMLPPTAAGLRLVLLAGIGAVSYMAVLAIVSPETVKELAALVAGRGRTFGMAIAEPAE